MRGPLLKIQNIDQNKTKHLHYIKRIIYIHFSIHETPQHRTRLLSMLSTPFVLQIESQLS